MRRKTAPSGRMLQLPPPRVGANLEMLAGILNRVSLQLTPPAWGRIQRLIMRYTIINLQLTPPRGGEPSASVSDTSSMRLQLTPPCGGEPTPEVRWLPISGLQLAPRVGRTFKASISDLKNNASTHAPRAWANLMRRKTAPSGRMLQLPPPAWGANFV